ncbi:MAG: AbrB/MazE/SpoVT family DNA-binding domain-containing protein [Alphaproteobacteria bacterium]|nr:AbrB/MazE/SpoVT family DNA-binding domain-containing protein [Alphaproteobacteria bacterium]
MKIKLVKIGNSYGVRLPKALLEEYGFKNEVNLTVRQGAFVLTPVVLPRMGWKELLQDEAGKHLIKAEGEWEW